MAIEIVSFPINSMVIFHSLLYVYQRVNRGFHFSKAFSVGLPSGKRLQKAIEAMAQSR
jgi:hypothetical protein